MSKAVPAEFAALDQQLQSLAGTLRLRWVGWVLDQLERREMLATDAPRPEAWGQLEVIDAQEFTQWLGKHLNVGGWRALLDEIRQHNAAHPEQPWDHAWPRDMLDALETVLQAKPSAALAAQPEPAPDRQDSSRAVTPAPGATIRPVQSDIVSGVEEQGQAIDSLKVILAADPEEGRSLRTPWLAWLLAPHAAAAVVRAQATSAKAFAELKRARSEAMLHALHTFENDVRSSNVLAQIKDLRKRLGPHLVSYCREHGMSVPRQDTEEEANLLFLLNAQLIALEDAQEEIAKRGADLARDKIRMADENARITLEAKALPARLEAKTAANPLREKLVCEEMRHRSASWVAQVTGAMGGAISGLLTALAEVAVATLAETAVVSAPPLIVFALTLVAETLGATEALTPALLVRYAGTALWNGALMLALTLSGYALWRYAQKRARLLETPDRPERARPPQGRPLHYRTEG